MSIRYSIWKVGSDPKPLIEDPLSNETLLEDMIVKNPAMLSDRWLNPAILQ